MRFKKKQKQQPCSEEAGVIGAGGGVNSALPPWSLRMETQTSLIV